jgi:tetratricopeptide (TPR) repeat protein
LFLSANTILAQTFTLNGGISNDNGTAESGVTVVAKSGGAVVESVTTTSSGRYKLELPYGKNYTIEITKPGFSKRFFNVDLSNVKEENLSSGEDFATQNVNILAATPGIDMSALSSQPITTFTFNKKSGLMTKDAAQESASLKAEQAVKTQKEKSEAGGVAYKAELEKQLKAKIKIGDDAMAAKDFTKAVKAYEEAGIFAEKNNLDDKEVQAKLIQAEDAEKEKKLAYLKEKQENAEFNKILDEAKKLEAKKDFPKALAKLEEAKAMKPENQEVQELLKKVNQAIAEKEAEEKRNADFSQAMTEGNQLFDAKDYENAIKKFEEAKKLKPSDKEPDLKIIAAKSKLEEQKKEADKLKNFEALLFQANTLKESQKYDEAIKKFEEAQLLFKDIPEPKEGIEECKSRKKEAEELAKNTAELAKRDNDFTAAMKRADDLFKAEKYKEAIKEYEAALKIKPEEELPKNQISIANEKIMELASAEERKKQFEQLKKEGEKALYQKQLSDAKEKFTQANALIPGDAFIQGKLLEIEKLEQENAATLALEEQFKDLMTRGETAIQAESFKEAKELFTQASLLKPNEASPKQKLVIVEKKIKEQEADAARKQQFDIHVANGTEKENAKDFKGALQEFTKAYELIKDVGVKSKIEQIQSEITNQENAAKRKQEYDATILKADAARNKKDWEKAIALYSEAKNIDPSQNYPDEQIALSELEINKLKGAAERLSIFNKLSGDAEKQFKEKKYNEAETTFKEALNFADNESDIKKTNDRLAEIAKILEQIQGEARKEKAFNDLITAAQNFEKDDNLKDAIAKYREALTIKPENPLPKMKEVELTNILEKREKEAKQKALFDGLMTQGEELFIAGKLKEAINKFEEAKLIYPNNKQPQSKIDEVNKKIIELANDAKEQAYQKILKDADNKRVDGKLNEAINLYNQALKERPNDPIPKEKIKEIEDEIAEKKRQEAELAEKKSRYAELLTQAAQAFDKKDLNKALALYTAAKQTLPNEADEADNKIEQINNLLASEAAAKQAEQERLAQLKQIMDNGDLAFKQDKYQDALALYNQAKTIAPEDDIVIQKIKITEDRIAEVEKSKLEKKLRDKLATADKAFADRKYDDALVLYNEILQLQPGHKKATEQIALIERIKAPVSDIADLPDLGSPSYYSIIQGEALLSQAERQKEYLRIKKLRDQLAEMEEVKTQQVSKETEEARAAWLNSRGIERDLEENPAERNSGQWIIEQIVREKLAKMSEKEKIENILAYKELVDIQANLRTLALKHDESVKGNIKNPYSNEDEIKAYLREFIETNDASKTEQLELLLKNDAFIHGLYNLNATDNDFSKAITTFNNLLLTSLLYDLRNSTPEQLAAHQAYLDNAVSVLNAYAGDLNLRTGKTYEKVTSQDAQIKGIYESTNEVAKRDQELSYEARQKMIASLRKLGDLMLAQNNEFIDNQLKFQNAVIKTQNSQVDVYLAEMTHNYLKLHQHDQVLKRIFKFDSKDYELWENDIKNAYAELKEINRLVLKENDRISEEKIKNAYRNNKDINTLVAEKSYKGPEDHSKQNELEKTVRYADRSANDKERENLNKAKTNIQENRALLDQLERKDFKFGEATANKLGELFPEGVTEENYVTKDDDDIVLEVKTRRIVVVNGSGNVYMRYSNRYGVTYTKNGTPITEYQWLKETQNAKLQKYKVN